MGNKLPTLRTSIFDLRSQMVIDRVGCIAAGGDGSDDQGCSGRCVAGGKDAVNGRGEVVDLQVPAGVQLAAEVLDEATVLDVHEAHRQQHQVRLPLLFAAKWTQPMEAMLVRVSFSVRRSFVERIQPMLRSTDSWEVSTSVRLQHT